MLHRTTPNNIQSLNENHIFVFGSNSQGFHNGGAARLAHQKFGAIYGQSFGFQGQSFGIDTMSGLEEMEDKINWFLKITEHHPHLTFLVTELGCGIAGHQPKDVAPFFKAAINIENIHLPESFWKILI